MRIVIEIDGIDGTVTAARADAVARGQEQIGVAASRPGPGATGSGAIDGGPAPTMGGVSGAPTIAISGSAMEAPAAESADMPAGAAPSGLFAGEASVIAAGGNQS